MLTEKKSKGKRYISDLWLLAAVLLIGLVLGSILLFTHKDGTQVIVRVSGEEIASFALDEEREYEITGKDGGRNLLRIKDGEVWMEEADCPDKLCVQMGKIRLSGQSIVCLPNKVTLELVSSQREENTDDVDVIVK